MNKKRIPKSKVEIKQDIKLVQDANHKRDLIRNVIFPYLVNLNENIAFAKIFAQTAATAVDAASRERQRQFKVDELLPRIREVLTDKTKSKDSKVEYERYYKFLELLKDEQAGDVVPLIQSLVEAFDQYFVMQNDKESIDTIDIDKILG